MQPLTQTGEQAVHSLAQRYGISDDAVRTLLFAVRSGNGTMAQFYHPELGGGGQWMRGGMTMVGDMFNQNLVALVNNLCSELSALLSQQELVAPPASIPSTRLSIAANSWWPPELGQPSSSGSQNESRYAVFPEARRLAILSGGELRIYDTLDHHVGGVSQQQGNGHGSLSFSSQRGTFTVDSLPRVRSSLEAPQASDPAPAPSVPAGRTPQSQDEVLNALERLGRLQQSGVLSKEEFEAKKAELLGRL